MNQKMREISKNIFESSIRLSLDSKHSLPKRERIQSMIASLQEMLDILDTERSAPSGSTVNIPRKTK